MNAIDSRVFWITLYVYPLIWLMLSVFAFVQLHLGWMLITIFGAALSGANLLGYYWCEKDMKQKTGGLVNEGMLSGLLSGMLSDRVKGMFGTRTTQI